MKPGTAETALGSGESCSSAPTMKEEGGEVKGGGQGGKEGRVLLADRLRLEAACVAAVHHHHLVVLGQEALQRRLGGPGDGAAEARPVAGPPEGVALTVLPGEDQQHLVEGRGHSGVGRRDGSSGSLSHRRDALTQRRACREVMRSREVVRRS